MAVLDSFSVTPNGGYGIHIDYNGRHFGQSIDAQVENFYVETVLVKLILRLDQDGDSGTPTNINCGIRAAGFPDGIYTGNPAEVADLATATPVSTSTLTTTPYDGDTTAAGVVEFVFPTPVLLSKNRGHFYVLTLDTPTVIIPIAPFYAFPMWASRGGPGLGTGWWYKTTAGGWGDFHTASPAHWSVNGVLVAELPATPPSDLITFPSPRPDDYDPDLIWQPGEWTDPTTYVPGDWGAGYVATGGGRWGQNLVVCGNKKIYYEPFEGV